MKICLCVILCSFGLANSGLTQGTAPRSGEIRGQGVTGESNSQEKETLYDRSGPVATPTANPYGPDNKRGRITFGKRAETSVKTESEHGIQKTKDGSSDATLSTGKFKESLIDSGLARADAPKVTPAPEVKATPNADAKVESSAAAKPGASAGPITSPEMDIKLGVSPSPSATVSGRP